MHKSSKILFVLGFHLPWDPMVVKCVSQVFPIAAFFCRSCSSRVWFCLVRRSMATVRVCTRLSRAVGRGLSPWMLLVVVVIKRVRIMQLLVWEAFVMAYKSHAFPADGANWWCCKYHQWATRSSHARNDTYTTKREDLTESTGVVPVEYSSKVMLELFSQL